MLNEVEKEELRRIVNKFVDQRRCFRPVHPDDVMKEVERSKEIEDGEEETASSEALPRFQP
jgi:hypothetical protein